MDYRNEGQWMKPSVFAGRINDDPMTWLQRFNKVSRVNGWEDKKKLDMAECCMEDAAEDWFEARRDGWTNWAEFETAFQNKYITAAYIERAWQQLDSCRQASNESVDELVIKLNRLFKRAKVTDDATKLRVFKRALRTKYFKAVLKQGPESYAQAIRVAEGAEERQRLTAQRGTDATEGAVEQPREPAAEVRNGGAEPVTQQDMDDLVERMRTFTINAMESLLRRDRQASNEGRQRLNNNRRCYVCQREGHMARDCTARRTEQINVIEQEGAYSSDDEEEDDLMPLGKRKEIEGKEEKVMYKKRDVKKEREQSDVVMKEAPPKEERKIKTVRKGREEAEQAKLPKRSNKIALVKQGSDYSIADQLKNTTANITMAQLLDKSPELRQQLRQLIKIDKELNVMESGGKHYTSAKVTVSINKVKAEAIIDTGAASSVISRDLLEEMNVEPNKRKRKVFVTADGKRHVSYDMVHNLPIRIGKLSLPANAAVFEREGKILVLGIDWMKANSVYPNIVIDQLVYEGEECEMKIPIRTGISITPVESEDECVMEEVASEWGGLEDIDWEEGVDENDESEESASEAEELYAVAVEEGEAAFKPVTGSERIPFDELQEEYSDVFTEDIEQLGRTTAAVHKIDTGESKPIKLRPYRVPQAMKAMLDEEIKKMMKNGIIEPADSPWCAPVVPIKKKDGGVRICVDYRKINAITRKDSYPLPLIDEMLDELGGAKVYTTLDARSGYWQVPLATEADRDKTAFAIPGGGSYRFKVMPMGLCTSANNYQRMMEKVFRGLIGVTVLVFIDDIVVYSPTIQQHLAHLREVLERCRQHKLQLSPRKCFIAYTELEYLGFRISGNGILPSPKKIMAISNAKKPTTVREVRAFIGLASYYRRFVPRFAEIARALNWLVKKKSRWQWSDEQQQAFEELKQRLTEAPILSFVNWELPFVLTTDGSKQGLGAILQQRLEDGNLTVVSYASRSLNGAEKNYSPTHLERLNQVIKRQMTKLAEGRENWDKELWRVMLIIRTMRSETTRLTPSKLLYGYEMVTPTVWTDRRTNYISAQEEVEERLRVTELQLRELRELAKRNATRAQNRQRERYDKKVVPRTFREGDQVLRRCMTPSGKFTNEYEGPYLVSLVKLNGVYEIMDGRGNKDVVHVDSLRPYNDHTQMIQEVRDSRLRSTVRRYRQP
jgi:hypothetical protein